MKIKICLLLLALLSLPVLAQSTFELFPADDAQLKVLDRDFQSLYIQSGQSDGRELNLYVVLSNSSEQSFLDVYQGIPWKKLYRWPVTFEGEKVKVDDRAAVHIDYDEETQKVTFYWETYGGYAEAAVHLRLIYDPISGKFSTDWSD